MGIYKLMGIYTKYFKFDKLYAENNKGIDPHPKGEKAGTVTLCDS